MYLNLYILVLQDNVKPLGVTIVIRELVCWGKNCCPSLHSGQGDGGNTGSGRTEKI